MVRVAACRQLACVLRVLCRGVYCNTNSRLLFPRSYAGMFARLLGVSSLASLPRILVRISTCWGTHLRSRSFRYHSQLFPLFRRKLINAEKTRAQKICLIINFSISRSVARKVELRGSTWHRHGRSFVGTVLLLHGTHRILVLQDGNLLPRIHRVRCGADGQGAPREVHGRAVRRKPVGVRKRTLLQKVLPFRCFLLCLCEEQSINFLPLFVIHEVRHDGLVAKYQRGNYVDLYSLFESQQSRFVGIHECFLLCRVQ